MMLSMNKLFYIYEPDKKTETIDQSILNGIEAVKEKFFNVYQIPEPLLVQIHPSQFANVTLQREDLKIETDYFGSKNGVKIYICDIDPDGSRLDHDFDSMPL